MVTLLLARGADVNANNASNYTALMSAVEGDRRPIVSSLLDHGAGIPDRNADEETALMTMARQEQTNLVQRLVEMESEINATHRLGDMALY